MLSFEVLSRKRHCEATAIGPIPGIFLTPDFAIKLDSYLREFIGVSKNELWFPTTQATLEPS